MKYALATIHSIYDIVKMIVLGTVMRLAMIATLVLSDVGMLLMIATYWASKL